MRAGPPVHQARARHHGAQRHPRSDALGAAKNVRLDSRVLARPPLPRAPHAGLDFIHNQQNAVLPANALQLLEEKLRSRQVSALTLDRLDDDSRDVLRIEQALEQVALEQLQNLLPAGLRRMSQRTAIGIWIRNVLDTGEQRSKSFALHGL